MRYYKLFICIILGLQMMLTYDLFSQQSFRIGDEMKTPSTDTWNFVKQGDIGANLHTGTVNLSIPVFTYKDNDFELPISLDYSSNGLVCNMRAGILGPDWVLNAGGSISVQINGIPDLYGTSYAKGFYHFHKLQNPRTDGTYWRYANFANPTVGIGAMSPEIIYVPDPSKNITSSDDLYDAEPDIFHFNFLGYSGSFHLGRNNKIYVYNTNGDNKLLDISITAGKSLSKIIITDKNGYKYIFDGKDSDNITDYNGKFKWDVGYKLSEIIAPNGRSITFEYNQYEIENYRPGSFYYTGSIMNLKDESSPEVVPCHVSDPQINECPSENAILSNIYVDDKPLVSFIYQSLEEGSKDQFVKTVAGVLEEFDDCSRLESIIITNPFNQNEILKKADFTYITTNGARTNYMRTVSISGEGTYTFGYHNLEHHFFPPIGTLQADHWGYYNDNSNNNRFLMVVSRNTNTLEESINSTNRNPNPTYAKCGILEKITYPTGGYSLLEYEGHDYSYAMRKTSENAFLQQLQREDGICGGVRLKSISNYSETDELVNSRHYLYTRDSVSSGILLYFPRYWINYSASTQLNFVESNINFYSNNLLSYEGNHIEYEMVTQINSDGSKEIFHFSNSRLSRAYRDESDISETVPEKTINYGEWSLTKKGLIRNIVSPAISKKAERGKLLKYEIYKANSHAPDKIMTFEYDTNNMSHTFDPYPVYLVRQFGIGHRSVDNYKLINTNQQEFFDGSCISQNESIQYNSHGQPSIKTKVKSDGSVECIKYEYAADYMDTGGIYDSIKTQHLLSYPVSEKIYAVDDTGNEILKSGKRYQYDLFSNMVKLSRLEEYDSQTNNWKTSETYTMYDPMGNLLESVDSNGLRTVYIWGYNGMYLVAKIENACRDDIDNIVGILPLQGALAQEHISSIKQLYPAANITTCEYKPLVGVSKITYPNGKSFTYRYNSSGKLTGIYDPLNNKVEEALYSTDNKQ